MAKKPTAEEQRHYKKVLSIGCIACRLQGFNDTPAEIHHLRKGAGMGQKSSNDKVIPLCPVHHKYGYKDKDIVEYGYHQSPKNFEERYGTELELLEKVRGLL